MSAITDSAVTSKPIILSKNTAEKVLLAIWTLTLLLFRPASLGEIANVYVFFAFLAVTLLILIIRSPYRPFVNRRMMIMYGLIQSVLWYLLVQGLILSDARLTVVNASIVAIGTSTFIFFVLASGDATYILKVFIAIHVILSVSAIVSTFLLAANGFNLGPLTLFRIPIYSDGHSVILPFSEYWSTAGLFGWPIPRFVGIYREPGASQIFFLTAFFLTYFIDVPKRKLQRIILVAGVFLLFSTAGIFNLIVGTLLLYITNLGPANIVSKFLHGKIHRHLLAALTILAVLTFMFFTVPSEANLFAKLGSVSGQSRSLSVIAGQEAWRERPLFGYGYYTGVDKETAQSAVTGQQAIGLLASGYQIGLVGVVMYLLLWWYGLFRTGNRYTLCIYLPCFLSILVFQPDFNGVFVWFLLLLDTHNFGKVAL